jgi:hypothetical protein
MSCSFICPLTTLIYYICKFSTFFMIRTSLTYFYNDMSDEGRSLRSLRSPGPPSACSRIPCACAGHAATHSIIACLVGVGSSSLLWLGITRKWNSNSIFFAEFALIQGVPSFAQLGQSSRKTATRRAGVLLCGSRRRRRSGLQLCRTCIGGM